MQQRDRVEKETKQNRVPFGGRRTKLQLSEADAKTLAKEGKTRWVNDTGGRVSMALGAGYRFVEPSEASSLGEGAIHQDNTDLGTRVSKITDRDGRRSYLMIQKWEHYNADRAETERLNDAIDQALDPVELGGRSIESGYTPD